MALVIASVLAAGAARAQSCDDGNACTVNDTIVNGVCTGTPRDCNDDNPCTDDACDSSFGCLHAASNIACDDGNTCTAGDACRAGTCVGGDTAAGCTACEAIAVLPADGGTFVGTTAGAATLAGSCGTSGPSPERVYAWTPATSGQAVVSTCGSTTTYDTVLYVRQGACGGSEVGCNDDATGCGTGEPNDHHGSHVAFAATAGNTYFIVVDGYNGAHGTYGLTVDPPATCGNGIREGAEECDGADQSCASGQCSASCTCVPPSQGLPDLVPSISDVSVEFGATVASGDVSEGCAEALSGIDLLHFGVTSLNAGTADLVFGDPQCPLPCDQHPLAICGNPDFICSPAAGHNHAHYTNYARYELLDGGGQTVVVGHKQGYCLRDTTCANPVYTCTDQGISAGCSDTYGAGLGCQYLDVTGLPSGAYTLRVTMDPFSRIAELSETNNVTEVPVTITRPTPTTTSVATATSGGTPVTPTPTPAVTPGATATASTGTCAAPIGIPAAGGVFTGTTAGTSALQGSCSSTNASPEQVFAWTPTASGTATLSTCSTTGTSFDTVLYVRGGSCAGTDLACNDDTTGCGTAEPSDHHASTVTLAVVGGQTYFVVVDGYGGAHGNFTLDVVAPAGATATPSTTGTPGSSITPTAVGSATPTLARTATATPTAAPATMTPTPAATVTPSPMTTGGAGTCAAPIAIPAAGGAVTGTTTGASALQGTCGSTNASPEQVFAWTPTASGTATISTCSTTGTTFDTVVYVRAGSCTGADLACNDDTTGCGTAEPSDHHGSRVSFAVTAGQTYLIVVDGYGGAHGNFTLDVVAPAGGASPTPSRTATPPPSTTPTPTPASTLAPTATPLATSSSSATPTGVGATTTVAASATPAATPGGSACSVPGIVPPDGGTVTGTTSGTGTLAGTCAVSQSSPEQVFQWTPSRSGTATIASCGSATTFDTVVYVRRDACTSGPQLACNDDTTGCTTGEPNDHHGSRLTTAVTAGTTYFIVVDGYNGAHGAFSLSVTLP